MLYVLSGISGVGKTTILNALLQCEPCLKRLVTITTRPPRRGEIQHVDYHFVTIPHFQEAVKAGHIVCPILYREQWYGTILNDLLATQQQQSIGILRPDKLYEISQFTTLCGIYIQSNLHQNICTHDAMIQNHRHHCQYQVINTYGDLFQTVERVLDIIHTHTGD